jgi:hypothetical protein
MKLPNVLQSLVHNVQAAFVADSRASAPQEGTYVSKTTPIRITEVAGKYRLRTDGLTELKSIVTRWKTAGARRAEVKAVLNKVADFVDQTYPTQARPTPNPSRPAPANRSARKGRKHGSSSLAAMKPANKWIN